MASGKVPKWLLALGSVLVALVFIEVGARVYLNYLASDADFDKYASVRQLQKKDGMPMCSPHRYLGYYLTPDYSRGSNHHNSLGYRGDETVVPKPAGEFRILCMGGSTVYSWPLGDYTRSFPYLLEKTLMAKGYSHIRVVNAGVPGWSSWESLVDFEFRGLDLDPDLIIICHGANDIQPRLVWPPEAYKGDNSGRGAPIYSDAFKRSIFEYSVVCRILMIRAGIIPPQNGLHRALDILPRTYYGALFALQKKQGTYPQGIFAKVSAMEMLRTNKPIYFERNIRNIVAIASSRHIATVISSFAYSPLFTGELASSEEFIYAFGEMNSLLKRISDETKSHFYDFAAELSVEKRFYVDGYHLSEEGYRLQAQLFADYLIRERLLPSPGK